MLTPFYEKEGGKLDLRLVASHVNRLRRFTLAPLTSFAEGIK